MKQIEIKGWIFARPDTYGNGISYEFSSFDYEAAVKRGTAADSWVSYKKLVPHTVRVEVPDDIDPVALMVAGLEAEREVLRAQFTARVSQINDKISKLQALPFVPAGEVQ